MHTTNWRRRLTVLVAVLVGAFGMATFTPAPTAVDLPEVQTIAATDWTPDLLGTGAKPSLGTGSTEIGSYTHDAQDWCRGFGLIRWGTGGNDGSGVYRLTLPEPADAAVYDRDPSNAEIIGTVTFGSGLTHYMGNLHLVGLSGYTSLSHGYVAIEGGLFLSDAYPNVTPANIHYHFDYACEPA